MAAFLNIAVRTRNSSRRTNHASNNTSNNSSSLFNGLYGSAAKFTINEGIREDGLVQLTEIKINSPINTNKEKNDIKHVYIDNTNLQSALSYDKVPIIAYTTDSWNTAFLGVCLFRGAVDLLIQPFCKKEGDSINTILQSFDERQLLRLDKRNNMIDVKYLNNVGNAPKVGNTSLVKSDVMGPDQIEIASLPDKLQEVIKNAKSNKNNKLIRVLPKGKTTSLPIQSPMPIIRPSIESIQSKNIKVRTTSKESKVVAFAKSSSDITRDKEPTDGLVSVRYLYDDDDESAPEEGKIRVGYMTIEDSKKLINKNVVKRVDWNKTVSSLSKIDKILCIHDVGEQGLAIVESQVETKVSTTEIDRARVEAYEREGKTYADWSIDPNVEYDEKEVKKTLTTAYGNFGFNRPCSSVNGLCVYKGTNNSLYVRPTPRKDTEDVTLSQRHRETFNVGEIPLINHNLDKLTQKALAKRKEVCPITEKFNQQVMCKLNEQLKPTEREKKKQKLSANIHANSGNSLQILTAGNSKTPGFSIGSHFDVNDAFQQEFNSMAGKVLSEYMEKALKSDDVDYIRAVGHMFRYGRLNDSVDTEYKYSLYTACGYGAKYNGNRKLSVMFVYDSINTAVNIPINVTAYNVFNGVWVKHHTSVPFTYDDKFVYLNDPELYVLAWGGGSSDKKDWLETNYPDININGRVNFHYFMNIVRDNNIPPNEVALAGLTGVNQTTIDDWLQTHGNV